MGLKLHRSELNIDLPLGSNVDLLQRLKNFVTHRDGARVFLQAGFEPKVAMQVNDIFTLLSIVSSGVGSALLPRRIAAVYETGSG